MVIIYKVFCTINLVKNQILVICLGGFAPAPPFAPPTLRGPPPIIIMTRGGKILDKKFYILACQ